MSSSRVLMVAWFALSSASPVLADDALDSLPPARRLSTLVAALEAGDEKVRLKVEPKLPDAVAAWAQSEALAIEALSQTEPVRAVARAHLSFAVIKEREALLKPAWPTLLAACDAASRRALSQVPSTVSNADALEQFALRQRLTACLPDNDPARQVMEALRAQLEAHWRSRAAQAEAAQARFARAMFKRAADVLAGQVPDGQDTLEGRTRVTLRGVGCDAISRGVEQASYAAPDAPVQAELVWTTCDERVAESTREGSYAYTEQVQDGTEETFEERCSRSGGENVWNPRTNSYSWREGSVTCSRIVTGRTPVYRSVSRTDTRTERVLEASLALAADLTFRAEAQTYTTRVEYGDGFTSVAWDSPSRRDFHRSPQTLAGEGSAAVSRQLEAARHRFAAQVVAAKLKAAGDDLLRKEDAWAFALLTQVQLPADGAAHLRGTYGWSPDQASSAMNGLLSPQTPWPEVSPSEIWPAPDEGYVRRSGEDVVERKLERVYSNQHFGASRSWNVVGSRTTSTQAALDPRLGLLLRWEGLEIDPNLDWQLEWAPAFELGWTSGGHLAFDAAVDVALAVRLGRLMLAPVARLGWGGVSGAQEGDPYRDAFAFHGGMELRTLFNVHRHHGLELDLSMTRRSGDASTWVRAAALRYHWLFEAFYDPWILDVGVFVQSADVATTKGLMIGLR